ncbi:MAG: acetate--CoA ligase family protein [Deltaproteobacteria bacterium]|nr:acetate--CoA ligase family protein [Deltaproteobacteria bacterium]
MLIADYCHQLGLQLVEFKDETKEQMRKTLPSFASISNPVDTAGAGGEAFNDTLRAIVNHEKDVDVIIASPAIGVIGDEAIKVAQVIVDVSRETQKTIVVLWMGAKFTQPAYKIIEDNGLPLFKTPLSCMQAIKGAVEYGIHVQRFDKRERIKVGRPLQINVGEVTSFLNSIGRKTLTEYEGKKLLSIYGIPVTQEDIATSSTEAVEIAKKLGYPVALKLLSPQIIHKTEARVVKLNINSDEELKQTYEEILISAEKYDPKVEIQGILVQEMLSPAYEVIIGVSKDPQFGPGIMFGLGGIFVEFMKDAAFRIPPLSIMDAEEMIREIKGFKVLEGYRGMDKADLSGIVNVLLKVSQLAADLKGVVSELDINPLFVFGEGKGIKAVDALVILE